MLKRFSAVLLCAVLLLFAVPTANAVSVTQDDLFGYGVGSPSDPFVITSGERLLAFRDQVNGGVSFRDKLVVLATDVSLALLGDEPIGTDAHPFDGVFDGRGHAALGLSGGGAMFGTVTGTVKNLTVYGSVSAEGDTVYASLLCEKLYGTVENCLVQGSVRVSSAVTAYAGGLCARVFPEGRVSSSYAAVSVFVSASSDAFAGGAFGAVSGEAEDCAVLHSAVSAEASAVYLGSLVGSVYFGMTKHCFAAESSPAILVGSVYHLDGGDDNAEGAGSMGGGTSYAENLTVSDYLPATCTAEGSCRLECAQCGLSETATVPAFGHVFTGKVMKEETLASLKPCTEASVYYYSCEACGTVTRGATFASFGGLALHTPSGSLSSLDGHSHGGECASCQGAYTESHTWRYTNEGGRVISACVCGEERAVSDALLVQNSVSAKAGKTVTVTFSLVNNPGISSAKLILTYDRSVLSLESVEVSGFSSAVTSETVNVYPYVVLLASAGDVTGDITVVSATFSVSESAPVGALGVSLSVEDAINSSFAAVSVDPAVLEDGLYVALPGDVNRDGGVDVADVTRLMQYLAEWEVSVDPLASDVTGDGAVDLADVTRLMQYLAEWDVTLQ